MKKPSKKPWPTKDAMQQVYAQQLWGAGETRFYSGEGSHLGHITKPYIERVQAFLSSFDTPLVVCDLGCGDFEVGKAFVSLSQKYIAVDIVPELIAHNRAMYEIENLVFQCLDIAQDPLPKANCALVRQVLQHLSNVEIHAILTKLSQYEYVIITEHVPKGAFPPNLDIISGQGTRLKKKSGVDVLKAPFEFAVKSYKEMVSISIDNGNSVIRTSIFEPL